MVINWKVELSNGASIKDSVDNGSWAKLQEALETSKNRIVKMSLESEHGTANIDMNADGYFLGNKTIAIMPSTLNLNLVAIGYWKKHDDMVRMKWYHKDTMNLIFTEARKKEECHKPFFIENNTNVNN